MVKEIKKSCRTCVHMEQVIDKVGEGTAREQEILKIARAVSDEPYVVRCAIWKKRGIDVVVMAGDPESNDLKNHDIRQCYSHKEGVSNAKHHSD